MSLWTGCCVALVLAATAVAQTPRSARPSEEQQRQSRNEWTIGLGAAPLGSLDLRLASDLQTVLNDGDRLRILPTLTPGALSNVDDLLYLRGMDVAFTQADAFEYFRTERGIPDLRQRVQYIMRLHNAELHVIAGPAIKRFEDLRGKRVSFGPAGGGAALTGPIVFQRLKMSVQDQSLSYDEEMARLLRGDLDAVVRVSGKPIAGLDDLARQADLHLLSLPSLQLFDDIYTLGEFTERDYPGLVSAGSRVETIAVPVVLAAFNWPQSAERYKRLERFTLDLFAQWERLLGDSTSPKWRDMNPAASLSGWTRFAVAQTALQQQERRRR
jgi:TRAP-type uncharacterized transport system substrate-binding protein